ncbi:RNA-guided endonuclease TnpB family protein [Acrocarpospora macrocephala]|uniref:Transposase n=1 Tax=Acrocarpospora macrocephala TaxID=150177 RepID=A0A5M3X156_9ACTN|nr:RNA-guided endonuclease TnpB family protein [Acrocarpospora macrocephala]GES15445.1 transposase [Acrocarpospora macrocephala]
MRLRYNYRLYPDASQRQALARLFGCVRVVWNDALAMRKAARKAGLPWIGGGDLQKICITAAKRTPEREWLGAVSAVPLQQSLRDLDVAYQNFFDSVSGKRKGRRMGLPVFKSRRDRRQSARFARNAFRLGGDGTLYLAKIGKVEVRWSRELPAAPSSVTVVQDAAGRFFASFVIEVDDAGQVLSEAEAEVGIDLGLTHYAVLSDGTKIANPRWLRRRAKRLARLQRALSRKRKGSKNREKARIAVARQHAKVGDARRDFLHQTSTSIIRENQTVAIEDLAVRGLARGRLAKSVNDASWGAFRTLLGGKAARYGRTLTTVDRWFPSSQLCPCCGWRNGKAPLQMREWDCPSCGEHHERDLAAALNILAEGIRLRAQATEASLAEGRQDKDMVAAGLADTRNDCGGRVRPGEAIPNLAPPATYDARAA